MKFTLEFEIGPDVMLAGDVPDGLVEAADTVAAFLVRKPGFKPGDSKKIKDENGNIVGSWKVTA